MDFASSEHSDIAREKERPVIQRQDIPPSAEGVFAHTIVKIALSFAWNGLRDCRLVVPSIAPRSETADNACTPRSVGNIKYAEYLIWVGVSISHVTRPIISWRQLSRSDLVIPHD